MTAVDDTVLIVEGVGGLVDGVRRVVPLGKALVVGRSRTCDLSLRRTRGFLRHPDPEAVMASEPFRRLSRVHCELAHVGPGRVEVRDLSTNGTTIDGARGSRTRVLELNGRTVEIGLLDPANGSLRLRLAVGAEAQGLSSRRPDA